MKISIYDLVLNLFTKKNKRLPWDFSSLTYKKFYPDIAETNLSARKHFRKIGIGQGRPYRKSEIISYQQASITRHRAFAKKNKTITVITDPKNSCTGSLNAIVPLLAQRYNIVLILNAKPDSLEGYANWCSEIIIPGDFDYIGRAADFWTKHILSYSNFSFVITDVALNGHLMQKLNTAQVASIFLLNDLMLEQQENIGHAMQCATRVVYSSSDCAETAVSRYMYGYPDQLTIVPAPCESTADNSEKSEAQNSAPHTVKLKKYAKEISEIGENALRQTCQERRDIDFLLNNPAIDYAYWTGNARGKLDKAMAQTYIHSWKNGLYPLRPRTGFHPGIYAEHTELGIDRMDPFVHYLKAGEPKGPWSWGVINRTLDISDKALNSKIGLHIHAYYPEMLKDIINRLLVNKIRPDLFISVRDETAKAQVTDILYSSYPAKTDIRIVPNRGRDIGPFLTEFGTELIEKYDIIGHIHTKHSAHVSDRTSLARWNEFLMLNLLGDGKELTTADTIIQKMHENPDVGLVFPDDRNAISWKHNRKAASDLAPLFGIKKIPNFINFPVGTMFWISKFHMQPFVNLHLTWDDYPEEPLEIDGTQLHAIERFFGMIAQKNGVKTMCTYLHDFGR